MIVCMKAASAGKGRLHLQSLSGLLVVEDKRTCALVHTAHHYAHWHAVLDSVKDIRHLHEASSFYTRTSPSGKPTLYLTNHLVPSARTHCESIRNTSNCFTRETFRRFSAQPDSMDDIGILADTLPVNEHVNGLDRANGNGQPCASPRCEPTVQQRNFSMQSPDALLHFQILDLGRQYFIWVSAVGPKLDNLTLAIQTPSVRGAPLLSPMHVGSALRPQRKATGHWRRLVPALLADVCGGWCAGQGSSCGIFVARRQRRRRGGPCHGSTIR